MEEQLVVKVKYGDTLRRFTTCVSQPVHVMGPNAYVRELDMRMDELKAKIAGLFNFNSDAELNITYIDEDGDVVTLVDDEDLADAIQQRINPLRLEVTVKNPRFGEPRTPSESSTPLRSPRIPIGPSVAITSGVEEALKSLPGPISSAISGLSHHLAAKATESAPIIRDIVEQITRLAQSNPGSCSQVRDGSEAAPVNPHVSAAADGSKNPDCATASQVKATSGSIVPPPQPVTPSVGNPLVPPSVVRPADSLMDLDLGLKSALPVASSAPVSNTHDCVGNNEHGRRRIGVGSLRNVSQASFFPPPGVDPVCPFTGMKLEAAEVQAPWPFGPAGPPLMHGWDGMSQGFHRGVICDGCGMHPIVGPRYKSKVKDDYDLCSVCFARMGNEADYTRMDRAAYRPPHTLREFHKHHPHFGVHHGRMPGSKHCKPKLESRFIKDVTILDGTVVSPNMPFTKIWRMRNSGTLPWPARSQLLWIGGDRMGNASSVDLEIPENGFPVDEELEIAVDFVSPPRPGRYTSYWRMASPTGQKFGQRVWVLVQVEMFPLDGVSHPQVCFGPLNLNLPPICIDDKQKGELMDLDIRVPPPVPKKTTHDITSTSALHPPAGMVSELDCVVQLLSEDNKDAGPISNISSPYSAPFIPYPTVNLPLEAPVKASAGNSGVPEGGSRGNAVEGPISSIGSPPEGQNNMETAKDAEEALLKELAEMGFKQIDLNKEVLRRNEYDLQQSVDDLCSASEWNIMLNELQEMGFCDVETNKRLLKKNRGSIKRVVLDLISGNK